MALSFQESSHLLRRTIYGASLSDINSFVGLERAEAVDLILSDIPLPAPPLNSGADDPLVPIGQSWVDAGINATQNLNNYRQGSIRAWMMELALEKNINIREKLVLFWHNHFVVSDINDARFLYRYINTIRENCLGNFKELVKAMTIDPAMLRYLNGNQNVKGSPNENYARELLELFTIGKGPLVGPGDHTHYTEDDVAAISKILTGWRDFGFNNPNEPAYGSFFRSQQHDESDKQLSHRFNNTVIPNLGETEYAALIDVIFEQEEVARFISRKLYRWFVHYNITDDIESNIIEPMAAVIRDNDYEIKPGLAFLFNSDHFFMEDQWGCMIKNPMDFVCSIFGQFDIVIDYNLTLDYRLRGSIKEYVALLQMEIFNPPSVAGWKAYYQEPSYYQLWVNSVTLPLMKTLTDALSLGINIMGEQLIIDGLSFLQKVSDPYDINTVINDFVAVMLPKDISQNQKDQLKTAVIPGLPDFEWTVEYSDYVSDPSDPNKELAIKQKMQVLILAILRMPEYHLS